MSGPERPDGVRPNTLPVALLVGGAWQYLWVPDHDVDRTVVDLDELGFTVTSRITDVTGEPEPTPEPTPEPERQPEPFRLYLVK